MKIINAIIARLRRSAIDLRAPVNNAQHKFGEGQYWYRADVRMPSVRIQPCLLSQGQIAVGLERAKRNPEDVA